VSESALEAGLMQKLPNQESTSIRLEAEKTIPVQYVVNVIDIVNTINKRYNTKHKVIMATSPKR
jgi:hypothetical protein